MGLFQHAAARRRLGRRKNLRLGHTGFNTQPPEGGWTGRPVYQTDLRRFNTQPPEGGWLSAVRLRRREIWFQHAAARRRLVPSSDTEKCRPKFQHAAARRRLGNCCDEC